LAGPDRIDPAANPLFIMFPDAQGLRQIGDRGCILTVVQQPAGEHQVCFVARASRGKVRDLNAR